MRIQTQTIALAMALGFSTQGCAADDDSEFAKQATSTGLLEIELGKHAAMNAEDAAVKRFGRMMVDDHSRANQELEDLARRAGIRLQSGMSVEQREQVTRQ
jgi:putative membrane protein